MFALQKAREKVLLNTLLYVGEKSLIKARENGNYTDQTGNLRSSIGYAILNNGKVLKKAYGEVVKDGIKGKSEANKFLMSLLANAPQTGFVLIVVAGMNYASYVENNGYDVLTSSELYAKQLLRNILLQLGL